MWRNGTKALTTETCLTSGCFSLYSFLKLFLRRRNTHQILGQDATPHHRSNMNRTRNQDWDSHEDEEGTRGCLGLLGSFSALLFFTASLRHRNRNNNSKLNRVRTRHEIAAATMGNENEMGRRGREGSGH
mgnify:CR=1 FL=1